MEYVELMDKCMEQQDSLKRLAFITLFCIAGTSNVERACNKPFNPLLGETFEFVTQGNKHRFIAEQVSHHPPIVAYELQGASGFKRYACNLPR